MTTPKTNGNMVLSDTEGWIGRIVSRTPFVDWIFPMSLCALCQLEKKNYSWIVEHMGCSAGDNSFTGKSEETMDNPHPCILELFWSLLLGILNLKLQLQIWNECTEICYFIQTWRSNKSPSVFFTPSNRMNMWTSCFAPAGKTRHFSLLYMISW